MRTLKMLLGAAALTAGLATAVVVTTAGESSANVYAGRGDASTSVRCSTGMGTAQNVSVVVGMSPYTGAYPENDYSRIYVYSYTTGSGLGWSQWRATSTLGTSLTMHLPAGQYAVYAQYAWQVGSQWVYGGEWITSYGVGAYNYVASSTCQV